MQLHERLETMDAQQLRELAAELIEKVARQDGELERRQQELHRRQLKIDQLTHEMALIKRWRFAARSEQLHSAQKSLLEETIEADLEAIATELEALQASPASRDCTKQKPKRAPLPAELPRIEVRHEPERTTCTCGCQMRRIGEDLSEKLDYTPGVFQVERHIRGKWACAKCQRLVQAPVPAQVIDKGVPTAGLLAQVLVAKYADHAPLYRQEQIFARAGFAIPRSTLAQWVGVCGVRLQPLVEALKAALLERPVLHADETPVAMLKPGHGKTHRAYLWSWCSTQFDTLRGVVYDFAETRGGRHAKAFLGGWTGKLVCDDYAGYKGLFEAGVTEAGCMAHARRKFHDLWANHRSQLAGEVLKLFGALYDIERDLQGLDADERLRIRQLRARPTCDTLKQWLILHRQKVPDGSATAKAIDYSLGRWAALIRYLDDGTVPIDNNWVENRIRPIALGRSNWLFAGSLRAGQRAAAAMSLIQSARLNGHDPYRYLKDVLERLPTQPASRTHELLPHRWRPAAE
jgi:transposase